MDSRKILREFVPLLASECCLKFPKCLPMTYVKTGGYMELIYFLFQLTNLFSFSVDFKKL